MQKARSPGKKEILASLTFILFLILFMTIVSGMRVEAAQIVTQKEEAILTAEELNATEEHEHETQQGESSGKHEATENVRQTVEHRSRQWDDTSKKETNKKKGQDVKWEKKKSEERSFQKQEETEGALADFSKEGKSVSENGSETQVSLSDNRITVSKNEVKGQLVSHISVSENQINSARVSAFRKSSSEIPVSVNQIDTEQIEHFQTPTQQNEKIQNEKLQNEQTAELLVQESVTPADRTALFVGFIVIFGSLTFLWFFLFQFQGGKCMQRIKKKGTKALGVFLVATLLVTGFPVQAQSVEGINTTLETAEQSAINEMKTTQKVLSEEMSVQNVVMEQTIEDIFNFEWKNVTDEEINKVLGNAPWDEIGVWLQSMTEEELEELYARDTLLTKETTVTEYDVAADGESMTATNTFETVFAEYALSQATDEENYGKFEKSSGTYWYQFIKGANTYTYTCKLSNLDTKTDYSSSKKATISVTASNKNSVIDFALREAKYNEEAGYFSSLPKDNVISLKEASSGNYVTFQATCGYKKPAGYTVAMNVINKNTTGEAHCYNFGTTTQYSNNSTAECKDRYVTKTNIAKNSTVNGATGVTYQFVFTPTKYTVNYNGNGATSGATTSQVCDYDTMYYAAQNGFTRAYTVTYNGNGGTPSELNNTANYAFTGWGWQTSNSVTHLPNAAYMNALTSGAGTFYAIWKPASVRLPSATRTGYTFAGWAGAGAAGANYTPTSNVTLNAQWTANKYRITLDSNGGTACEAMNATYDQNVALPIPTRVGYTFTGWSGAGGTHQGTVKNLSAVNNATVALTAGWSANTDTPYTINRYVQKDIDSEEYVLYESQGEDDVKGTEILTGTTDTIVAVPALTLNGYDTPDSQTVKITGDGKAVVNFYYKKTDTRATLTVNHYIQKTPGGEFELFTGLNEDGTIKEGFENFQTEYVTYNGTIGEVYNPPVCDLLVNYQRDILATGYHFELPQPQTVTLSKVTEVNYYYTVAEDSSVEYIVEHHIKKNPNGNYELYKTEKLNGDAGEVITPSLNEDAIKAVNAVSGCVCEKPTTQTVTVAKNLIVKYYYDCVKKETAGAGTGTGNGLTDIDISEIAKKLAAGLSFSLDVDGVSYEIAQNPDGTLGIKFVANSNAEKIVIPDVVTIGDKVYRITEIYEKAFKDNKTLKEVVLSQNISKIGDSAFEGCSSLQKVTLQEGLVTIGNNAFKDCISLTSIKTPSTLQTISNSAFENCTKLKTVTLNEGLITIGNKAFYKCSALTKIKIPKTVLKIGNYAFGKCIKLKKVTFASGAQLLSIGSGIFSDCVVLAKIKLPDKLTAISTKAFKNCKKMSSVTIGKAVTKIGTNAFEKCVKIKKVTIPTKVQTIGKEAFYKCKSLSKVTIKSKAITSIGSKAFKKCNKKIVVSVPSSKKAAYTKLLKGKL